MVFTKGNGTLGAFRLLLASCVVIGHAMSGGDTPYFSLLSGYYAVQLFFVVSGFYMALVLDTKYLKAPNGAWRFYGNRMARLLPTYWAVVIAFVAMAYVLHRDANLDWLFNPDKAFAGHPLAYAYMVFTNLLLIGQDLPAFIDVNGSLAHTYLIVQQAWSVGTEIWFYLAAPWLVKRSNRTLIALVIGGLTLRFLLIASDLPFWPWQQRLVFTEYVYFLTGILSYRAMMSEHLADLLKSRAMKIAAVGCATVITCFIGQLGFGHQIAMDRPWAMYAAGIALAGITAVITPTLFWATKNSALDRLAGDFSYPVYMVHLNIILLFPNIQSSGYGVGVLCASLLVSVPLVFLLERPIDAWRHSKLAPFPRLAIAPD